MKLSLHTQPDVPLEAEVLTPGRILGEDEKTVSGLPVFHGNRQVSLGDFFKVTADGAERLELEGDLRRVKYIGADMKGGQLIVNGSVGAHLGARMAGGDICVTGDAGDWVGPEMVGGRITVKGNAGHMVGSAIRGCSSGIQGGEIIVHGSVRNEAGNGMRRGLIVVGGDSGDFTGVNMLAGTIVVLGQLGIRSGASMKRGTIVSMCGDADILPTFSYDCAYTPSFMRLCLLHLRKLGMAIDDRYLEGRYHRWRGDAIELSRGELLLLAA